jgi:hypothetical protein
LCSLSSSSASNTYIYVHRRLITFLLEIHA